MSDEKTTRTYEEFDLVVPVRCRIRIFPNRTAMVSIQDQVARVSGEFLLKEFESEQQVRDRISEYLRKVR